MDPFDRKTNSSRALRGRGRGVQSDYARLTARLFRTKGHAFQSGALHRTQPTPAASSGGSSLPPIGLRAPNSGDSGNAALGSGADFGDVEVPGNLKSLLGQRVGLRPPSSAKRVTTSSARRRPVRQGTQSTSLSGYQSLSRAGRRSSRHAAGGPGDLPGDGGMTPDRGLFLSSRGQLPLTRDALRAWTTVPFGGGAERKTQQARKSKRTSNVSSLSGPAGSDSPKGTATKDPSRALAKQRAANRERVRDTGTGDLSQLSAQARQLLLHRAEFEYLQSPFSFIDKVIENPYTEEFVYLHPRGPYDLQIVRHNQVNPDNYFTMSRAGVTHFFHGETEFTELDQWEREYFLFTNMMQIGFFKRFRKWKSFYFWKKYIRRRKRHLYSQHLEQNLYILNPNVRQSLIDLRGLCVDCSAWELFSVSPKKKTQTLAEFKVNQRALLDSVSEQLGELSTRVSEIALAACKVDLQHFLIRNGFRSKTDSSYSYGRNEGEVSKAERKYELNFHGGGGDDSQISHAEHAAIRTKCRNLTKYIRLCDYVVIDTLVSLCLDRVADLLKHVRMQDTLLKEQAARARLAEEKEAKRAKHGIVSGASSLLLNINAGIQEEYDLPLFSIEAVLEESGEKLWFTPRLAEVKEILSSSIESVVNTVMSVDRLIDQDEFNDYIHDQEEGDDEDGNSEFQIPEMVLSEKRFLELTHGIKQGLHRAFADADLYVRRFEPYRLVFVENLGINIRQFRDKEILFYHNLIKKYNDRIAEFEKLPTGADIGIVHVDSRRLKAVLEPSNQRCMADIHFLLPDIARAKSGQLLGEIREIDDKLKKPPSVVADFVEMLRHLRTVEATESSNHHRFLYIRQLYELMQRNEVEWSAEDQQQLEDLKEARGNFANRVKYAQNKVTEDRKKFKSMLSGMIPGWKSAVDVLQTKLNAEKYCDVQSEAEVIIPELKALNEELTALETQAGDFQDWQNMLDTEVKEFEEVRECRTALNVNLELWEALESWSALTEKWIDTPLQELDPEAVQCKVTQYSKVWARANREKPDNALAAHFREKINVIHGVHPVVVDLRNPNLADRHWEEIERVLMRTVYGDENFTLGVLMELNGQEHKEVIANISNKATQEAKLRRDLDEIIAIWDDMKLPLQTYKGQKDVYILGNLDEIMEKLDENLVGVNAIAGNRFSEVMRDDVVDWNYKLVLFQDTLNQWAECQRQWLYLSPIFSSQDIIRQLQEEYAQFSKVDKEWKKIMRRTHDLPNAISAGTYMGLKESLIQHNEVLERVQKQLDQYLETKRVQFPRFYFLSNDELLRILEQAKNVMAVQPHLRKCFDNIERLDFKDRYIRGMHSADGEYVELGKTLQARGSAELWLANLEQDMFKQLSRHMYSGLSAYDTMSRKEWVLSQIGQVVMTVAQIIWCRECEKAIESDQPVEALAQWHDSQLRQLFELTEMVRGDLSKVQRRKLVSLITTDVHARDVTAQLRDERVSSLTTFTWQQQLRFYWDTFDENCVIRQSNAKFMYGYEYMGVCTRLVITPLTDRCWMTVTSALHLRFGASPAGPAGTGKTESVKDLAKAMGQLCVVFNCSEQITYKVMGRLFSGLAQTGAWTCLDEFNRIDIEVLSVIAQQLLSIRFALLDGRKKFSFEGSVIALKPEVGVMITMNPGYAGRTELPDNLKVLFRPVAMMIPDYALIAEIMLFAEGFDNARALSKKMVKLYKLSSEQLSQQYHYDFGMRAVKSVLVMAGALKRAEPELDENAVLIRAMRDSNIPKFLVEDIPLFQAIVRDLFPDVTIPPVNQGDLQGAIKVAIREMGLQQNDKLLTKVLQLYDTFNVRFGVMLVGPTGAGKTVCYQILALAMTRLREQGHRDSRFQVVHTNVLNPKCITMGELYGDVDALTGEWTDGLCAHMMREAIEECTTEDGEKVEDRRWVVFDGPVDSLWIENMNTVLDDNMTLCLVNGERIKLKKQMRMLFETEDLEQASPATVSRCGMVYLTPSDLGYLPYVRTWLEETYADVSSELYENLLSMFESKLPEAMEWVEEEGVEPIPTTNLQRAAAVCSLFESVFSTANNVDMSEPMETLGHLLEMCLSFCLAWGLGGALGMAEQAKFNGMLAKMFVNIRPGSFFLSYVDVATHNWMAWESMDAMSFRYDKNVPYSQVLVPTRDTVRFSSLVATCLGVRRPTFLTGMTGVGKSVIINDLLRRLNGEGSLQAVTMTFSAQTSSRKVQDAIEVKLHKKKGRPNCFGASKGRDLVIFVDDVNMPTKEKYGAQPPIELLRQLTDQKGWYDRTKFHWKAIEDCTPVCAAAPPGGGRSTLTPRFTRHFALFNLPAPEESVLQRIFGSILNGFFHDFNPRVHKLADPLVSATVDLHETISRELLPTPAKSHYTFNLRDVSKVFQGILMIHPSHCRREDTLVRLWVHECQRCFGDRLVSKEDRVWLNKKMAEMLSKHFHTSISYDDLFVRRTITFGSFKEDGVYEEYRDIKAVQRLMESYLMEYNMDTKHTPMNLVFFQDAIEHVSRISRVLMQPRGNCMLVGVGGSGKQSLTRLASAMRGMECYEIELRRNYSYRDFQDDLREVIMKAGIGGKDLVFLFNENQIVEERFLEDINNILNSGEVPNLFQGDDVLKIIEEMVPIVREMGLDTTRDVVYEHFVRRVRDHLHIVLCMSPVGKQFRERCRVFPSLINCCTIDWFQPWPEEALLSVSQHFLKDMEVAEEYHRRELAEMCVAVHTSMSRACDKFYRVMRRKVYTTPRSYLDLIEMYQTLLKQKTDEVNSGKMRLLNGLQKLKETQEMVTKLSQTFAELQPMLEEKSEEVQTLYEKAQEQRAIAEKKKTVVEAEEGFLAEKMASIRVLETEARADYDAAKPEMEAAISAVRELSSSDIAVMKQMYSPPPGVVKTMEAVCILLGYKADWDTAKRLMASTNFINMLMKPEALLERIDAKTSKRLQKYINAEELQEKRLIQVSSPSNSMMKFVRSMINFSRVMKTIAPKEKHAEEMKQELAEAQRVMEEKQSQLREAMGYLAALDKKVESSQKRLSELTEQIKTTEIRKARATTLIELLKHEQVRWHEDAEKKDHILAFLVGDMFVSAACVSYFGPFTLTYRQELVKEWVMMCRERKIPISDNFSLRTALGTSVEIREWMINQLPSDAVSVDSALVVKYCQRYPLIIDPQQQAVKWIRSMYRHRLRSARFSDKDLLGTVEIAMRDGNALLIEDVGEQINQAIDPVLQRAYFMRGGIKMIRLGDKDLEVHKDFELFMCSKLSNPHYLPELCIKVTLLNFTVTPRGLEDQLLGEVVKRERADIEKRKNEGISQLAKDRKSLLDIEETILRSLAESGAGILDNDNLINSLRKSKNRHAVIEKRVNESIATDKELNLVRDRYQPVAERGSILYFVIADLASVDPMYQYSLEYFLRLYAMCIEGSQKSDDLQKRLDILLGAITRSIFLNVSRGLFESHKLIFAILICVQVMRQRDEIDDIEWNFLIRPVVGDDSKEDRFVNPLPGVVSEHSWISCIKLEEELKCFRGLPNDITTQARVWKTWVSSSKPHQTPLPGSWDDTLSSFQKLLLLKAFRPEKLLFAFSDFVAQHMGREYVDVKPGSLADVFEDTDEKTPVIFVLSSGADPTQMLMRYATEKKMYPSRFNLISLGQGQGERASRLVADGAKYGHWVLLQNCHLARSFMGDLESIVDDFQENRKMHPDFRLWLTSFPCSYFPVAVLQRGVKLTNEPPKGLRSNVLRSFKTVVTEQVMDSCSKRRPWQKLVFGLCFFHAIIQERKKFGPLGWNKSYEFNDSDLDTSLQVLRMFLEEQDDIPWDSLKYMCGQINYGGRVTDDWDRRCLMSILRIFYTPSILDDSYTFSPSGTYLAPAEGPYEMLIEYVEQLPLAAEPEIFGMHENANITFQKQEVSSILNTILALQPRTASVSAGKHPDVLVSELAQDMEEKMPRPLTRQGADAHLFKKNQEGMYDSLTVVLMQEMERYNRLLGVMKATLVDIQRAIRGEVVMSLDLDKMYTALLNNQIPKLWSDKAYPSVKPLSSWFRDLRQRIEVLEEWLKKGSPNSFWLSGFFFPQGFITGVLQNFARKYRMPIDSVTFSFEVLKEREAGEIEQGPEDGVYIYGLFLDGARWDEEKGVVAESKLGELTFAMPIIHFLPTPLSTYEPGVNDYECPVYKTSVRAGVLSTTGQSTNFILPVQLPSSMPADHWVLMGTALLCQLDT